MTPELLTAATVGLFVLTFIGQLLRRNRRPWLLPLVAAGGFALLMLLLTQVVLPRMQDAMLRGVQRAVEPVR